MVVNSKILSEKPKEKKKDPVLEEITSLIQECEKKRELFQSKLVEIENIQALLRKMSKGNAENILHEKLTKTEIKEDLKLIKTKFQKI